MQEGAVIEREGEETLGGMNGNGVEGRKTHVARCLDFAENEEGGRFEGGGRIWEVECYEKTEVGKDNAAKEMGQTPQSIATRARQKVKKTEKKNSRMGRKRRDERIPR